jgi:hypothetical protein
LAKYAKSRTHWKIEEDVIGSFVIGHVEVGLGVRDRAGRNDEPTRLRLDFETRLTPYRSIALLRSFDIRLASSMSGKSVVFRCESRAYRFFRILRSEHPHPAGHPATMVSKLGLATGYPLKDEQVQLNVIASEPI